MGRVCIKSPSLTLMVLSTCLVMWQNKTYAITLHNSLYQATSSQFPQFMFSWLNLLFIYLWVRLTCALRAHINKFVFGKNLMEIEKAVKTFSIFNKTFSKNGILLCAFRTQINKILFFHIVILVKED